MRMLLGRALKRAAWPLFSLCSLYAQPLPHTYTWQQLRDRFEAANPTLRANQLNIDESRAAEVTAFLRPNPDLTLSTDGTQLAPYNGVWRPLSGTQYGPSFSYLHERDHKRELRRNQAMQSTAIARSTYDDQARTLVFNLRNSYVQTLQAKAVLENARQNIEYWDKELALNRIRLAAGDIAQVDMNRMELQRVQFESDVETALVNLRTAKIQLLNLLNDRTPLDLFDVTGPFDFTSDLMPLEEFRKIAIDARPDLKAATQSVELAKISHQLAIANSSTDPTFTLWVTHNPSFNNPFDNNTIGGSISIPLRIFDRNQGEKERTALEIRRTQRLLETSTALVFNDVDSAWWTLSGAVTLLRTYQSKYLALAADTRDRIAFSYQHGGASLLDYLDSEKSFRDTRLAWLNLVGSYLTAAAQMNLALGREVMQ